MRPIRLVPGLGPYRTRIWLAAPFLEKVTPADADRGAAEARAIERRRAGDHLCLLCGVGARAAMVARVPTARDSGPGWVDLCWGCYTAVLAEN